MRLSQVATGIGLGSLMAIQNHHRRTAGKKDVRRIVMTDSEEDNHQIIYGASNGYLRVDVLDKPVKGTKRDFIRLSLKSSRKGSTEAWHAFTEWEAFQIARMLLWAVSKRNKGIKLEEMK